MEPEDRAGGERRQASWLVGFFVVVVRSLFVSKPGTFVREFGNAPVTAFITSPGSATRIYGDSVSKKPS